MKVRKKERVKSKRESRRITEMHESKMRLRSKANNELKILLQLFGKEITCELELFKEIKFHLESSQKELTYFGYRGIIIGVVVAVLTSFATTQGLPIIFNLSEQINSFQSLAGKITLFIVLVVAILVMSLLFMFVFLQIVSPFFKSEKEIRNQIYINEYMIKTLEEKIEKRS